MCFVGGVSPSSLAQTTILCILQLLNSILASSVEASSVSVRKQTCVDRITVPLYLDGLSRSHALALSRLQAKVNFYSVFRPKHAVRCSTNSDASDGFSFFSNPLLQCAFSLPFLRAVFKACFEARETSGWKITKTTKSALFTATLDVSLPCLFLAIGLAFSFSLFFPLPR